MEKNYKFKFNLELVKLNFIAFCFAFFLLNPVILFFYESNNLSLKDLFIFQGIFYFFSVIAELVAGFLSDNISRKYLILISMMFLLFQNIIYLNLCGYFIILAGEIIFAFSKTLRDNVIPSYLYDYLFFKRKTNLMTKSYGCINFFFSLSTAVSSVLGALIYKFFNFNILFKIQIFIITTGVILISLLPNIKTKKINIKKKDVRILHRIKKFILVTKILMNNKSIMFYIYYSAFITSCAILFSLGFQPLMKNSSVPLIYFGIVYFFNHITRAISSIFPSFSRQYKKIKNLVFPLYMLYISAFLLFLYAYNNFDNKFFVIPCLQVIGVICFIISIGHFFIICHISRLQSKTIFSNKGNVMMINDVISKIFIFIILILSVFNNENFINYFVVIFILLSFWGLFFMKKIYLLKEDI